jgi:2-polyprenyl-6-methoxyphenol hydroxylase-like FAD-dependent oxidoreductase
MDDLRILVVGAGIAGLGAARALRQRGFVAAEGAAMALEDGLVLAECLASGDGVAETIATFQARRQRRTQWVLAQTHRRDRTRNLPPVVRDLVLRTWGRNIVYANYRPLLDLP